MTSDFFQAFFSQLLKLRIKLRRSFTYSFFLETVDIIFTASDEENKNFVYLIRVYRLQKKLITETDGTKTGNGVPVDKCFTLILRLHFNES